MIKQRYKLSQAGFTIIELMIAAATLSLILLIAAIVIGGIGKTYMQGINRARIQNNVRSIGDEISQKIQLDLTGDTGPAQVTGAPGSKESYCIGATRYTFKRGVKIDKTSQPHILWRDTAPSGSGCAPANIDTALTDGVELMLPNSRLVTFNIASVDGSGRQPYNLTIKVAYGDDDLLCSQSALPVTCSNPSATMPIADYARSDLTCKSNSGSQFCATASFKTVVGQRLQ